MDLDPQLKVLLAGPEPLRLPDLATLTPAEARAVQRLKVTTPPPRQGVVVDGVVSWDEVISAGEPLQVRCYKTDGLLVTSPGILYLHGGGWVLGDLDSQDATCRSLAKLTGAFVASLDYRLAPENPFPAALEDSVSGARWMLENASRLGFDVSRLGIAGSSAGANLAAATALWCRDHHGPALIGQLLAYPALDPLLTYPSVRENAQGYYLTAHDMKLFIDAYLPNVSERKNPYAAPLYAGNLFGLPDAVIATAGYDPLRDEGTAYSERLLGAGVNVRHLHFPDLIHGFLGLAGAVDAAGRARAECFAAFRDLMCHQGDAPV